VADHTIENSWREPPAAPRFCGSFWSGFDGLAVASTRGRRQTEEGEARDRSSGCCCEVAKDGLNAPRYAANSSQRRYTFT